METKKCSKCKNTKNIDEFHTDKSRNDGHASYCKECDREYHRQHYLNHKQYYKTKAKKYRKQYKEWFKSLKQELSCASCNEDHIACLVFHHLDPSKKDFDVSKCTRNQYSKLKVLQEIEKCVVLCSNCHRKLHYMVGMV